MRAVRNDGRTAERSFMAIGALSTSHFGSTVCDGTARSSHKGEKPEYQKIFQEYKEELFEKLKKGETETSFQIGASSFTMKEWDRFLEKFDSAEETVKKAIQEEIEKKKKESLEAAE